jgi:hypothetical protein
MRFAKPDAITGSKPEEALSILNMKLSTLVRSYKTKLRALIDEFAHSSSNDDMTIDTNVAVALYFSSYFHARNLSCKEYLAKFGNNSHLFAFLKAWETDLRDRHEKVRPKSQTRLLKCLFEDYLGEMRKVEEFALTNPKRF